MKNSQNIVLLPSGLLLFAYYKNSLEEPHPKFCKIHIIIYHVLFLRYLRVDNDQFATSLMHFANYHRCMPAPKAGGELIIYQCLRLN